MDILFIIIGLTSIILAGFLSHYIRKYNKLQKEYNFIYNSSPYFSLREKDCEIQYTKFFGNMNCQIVNDKVTFVINDKNDKDVIRIPLDKLENYSFEINWKGKIQWLEKKEHT